MRAGAPARQRARGAAKRAARCGTALLLALALGLTASLSACGKKGSLEPPSGKKTEYPRTYPRE